MIAVLAACGAAPVGPGFYRVERGDTLSSIARSNRTSVQNIARWNGLTNPDAIESGQVLRVAPPANSATAARGADRSSGSAQASSGSTASRGTTALAPAPTAAPSSTIALVWPAQGTVTRRFDGANSKGIDIVNVAGTPVVAAAAGSVVYAGDGLRGYGNLIIIKHNSDYLSAYAHNRAMLVKEGQTVAQGQKIAEMGDTDSDHVMLHFELRYQSRSIDPARSLPPR
ncbi:peptidoglycan DD-metalloendopeptidase family protein [Paraburkholderia sartisoli]|uniref:Murein DD-endopeptidase MepM and murein hydrolase activator NlpD, contain LysM domain n=1 Tax=Paraburkholderia sartisoli TaxID=83784 RepID=A0A1H3ZQV9_9BURK|nr:peptidoglycan DD-metalloendopeptidase family protein [Paraburkholderia sartisoli]SEA26090.1 Murein DD-endopeptidase MepM and murein hydrolase activator NlpD, contain LysM domain [Paraburkholderia sartisoli]